MVVYIGGVLVEEDWRDCPILFMDIVNFGVVSIFLVILLHLSQKLGIRLPKVPNPFARVLRGPGNYIIQYCEGILPKILIPADLPVPPLGVVSFRRSHCTGHFHQ